MTHVPSYLATLLPATKLTIPVIEDTVKRSALLGALRDCVLSRRLTLISAPVGSGKTTLAADFARSADDCSVCWLSLDSGDNELSSFLLAFAFAVLAGSNDEMIQMVSHGQMPGRQVANVLINHLAETDERPIVLVLDDLHLLTSAAIYDVLDYFVARMPAHVHLLGLTRYDPPMALPRLRANGDLAELRLDALRFDHVDVVELLNRRLGLSIPDGLIRQMLERTEGWIAGLRLLALSLKTIDEDKRVQYIADLSQQDRYVFELLAGEVLYQQREEIRRFLLETAILSELTPESCAAVTQQADAASTLRALHRNNLFLVALGDGTYRYHALFRDFLLSQLAQEDASYVRELHYRAAQAQVLYLQKLEHLVAAAAWDEASSAIGQIVKDRFVNIFGNFYTLQLDRVISRIPETWRETHPWLLFVRGSTLVSQGYYQDSVAPLAAALNGFRQQGDKYGQFLAELLLLVPEIEERDDGESLSKMLALRERYAAFFTPELRLNLLQGSVWNSAWNYRHEALERHLQDWIEGIIAFDKPGGYFALSQSIGSQLFFTTQGSAPFERILPYLEDYAGDGKSVGQMGVCNIRGLLALLHGDINAALSFARCSSEIVQFYGGFAWADAVVDTVMMAAMLIRSDYAALDRYYETRMPQIMRQDTIRKSAPEMMYFYGQRLLRTGQLEPACRVVQNIQDEATFKEYRGLALALDGHLARIIGDFREAEQLLQQALEIRTETRRYFPTHVGLGLALLYWEMDEPGLALDTLRNALEPITSLEYWGIVLLEGPAMIPLLEAAAEAGVYPDACRTCLDLLDPDASRRVAIPGSCERLTPRETDILRLIVTGASNRDIAGELVISENTVKSHVTRILGKLEARSRTEAAARVLEMGLVL